MASTNINTDWMYTASSGLRIILIILLLYYAGPLSCILGCNNIPVHIIIHAYSFFFFCYTHADIYQSHAHPPYSVSFLLIAALIIEGRVHLPPQVVYHN